MTPQGVRIEMAGLGGLRGEFDAEIYNPNPVGLPLRRVEYRLRIGGAQAVQGSLDLNETIPAQGSVPVTIAFAVNVVDALRVTQRLATGERAYTITGTLVFATRLGDLSVAFEHQGELGQ